MDEGRIANFGIFLDVKTFCILDDFFRFSKHLGFWVFLVQQTMVETTLPNGLETSGRMMYRKFWRISRRFGVFAF